RDFGSLPQPTPRRSRRRLTAIPTPTSYEKSRAGFGRSRKMESEATSFGRAGGAERVTDFGRLDHGAACAVGLDHALVLKSTDRSEEGAQIVGGEAGLAQDRPEGSALEVAGVDGHRNEDARPIGVPQI